MRGRILDAAAVLFAEHGFEGTRVDQIARKAGVNKASLYYHIGDKAVLYEAVLLSWVERVLAEVRLAAAPGRGPVERLSAIPRALERLMESTPHFPRIMIREMASGAHRLTPPVLGLMKQLLGIEEEILEEGRKAGAFRKVPLLSLHILLVVGTVIHFAGRSSVGERMTPEALGEFPPSPAEAVSDLLMNGLLMTAAHDIGRS